MAIVLAFLLAAGASDAIRTIDFKNRDFPWFEEDYPGSPDTWRWIPHSKRSSVRLVKGRFDFGLDSQEPGITFNSVVYGDLDGDGVSEAAVDLIYHTGGSGYWHYLYVYTPEHGSIKLLGVLRSAERSNGGLIKVRIQDRRLVLDFQDPERQRAACCSEGYVRVRYRWKPPAFVEDGPRRYGTFPPSMKR